MSTHPYFDEPIGYKNIRLYPLLETLMPCQKIVQGDHRIASVLCEMRLNDGTLDRSDPRQATLALLEQLHSEFGLKIKSSFETQFGIRNSKTDQPFVNNTKWASAAIMQCAQVVKGDWTRRSAIKTNQHWLSQRSSEIAVVSSNRRVNAKHLCLANFDSARKRKTSVLGLLRNSKFQEGQSLSVKGNAKCLEQDVMLDMVKSVTETGVKIDTLVPQLGDGQYEVTFENAEGIKAADMTAEFKTASYVYLKMKGYNAEFMACVRPNVGLCHSLHHNFSLWDAIGRNILVDPEDPCQLSEFGRHWLAGLVKHTPGMTALSSPTINCYSSGVVLTQRWRSAQRVRLVGLFGGQGALELFFESISMTLKDLWHLSTSRRDEEALHRGRL
ncbi:glutamine synthetase [Plakobranchus ocellatus]|uniref:Lengsin n=1 Tax=Plakobranchus ocellatus TaxID=259542 RepID=A0AAV4AHW2_9GAST|nr:glutamine synthetase [Plakobranchus ocellatus]